MELKREPTVDELDATELNPEEILALAAKKAKKKDLAAIDHTRVSYESFGRALQNVKSNYIGAVFIALVLSDKIKREKAPKIVFVERGWRNLEGSTSSMIIPSLLVGERLCKSEGGLFKGFFNQRTTYWTQV